jgi:hypothetical protein
VQVILACTIFFVLQNIQEQRNHACIDQVGSIVSQALLDRLAKGCD